MAQIAIIREKHVGGYMQAALDSGYAARTDIDESRPCDKGKLRTSGFLEDDFTGQVTITFDKCKQGKDFLDGALTFRIDRFDLGIETRMRLSFTALHVRNNDFDVTLGGDASYSSDTASNKQTEKITDLVIVDNNSGRSLRIVDLVSVYTFDNIFVPRRVTIKIKSGRVYVSRYGYVDVESTVVIDFASIDQSFPDSGVYDLTANGSIRATAQSRTSVLIEADTNDNLGDGYEFTATIDWSDL